MKRYDLTPHGKLEEKEHGDWVRWAEVVNDKDHIPSMQINELARRLESLETSIEKGRIETKKLVWEKMKIRCEDYERGFFFCTVTNDDCSYNNCPLLKGIK